MAEDPEPRNVRLVSNVSSEEAASLPSSPTAPDADMLLPLPFVVPACSLAIQSKRALIVRNALVASDGEILASCVAVCL